MCCSRDMPLEPLTPEERSALHDVFNLSSTAKEPLPKAGGKKTEHYAVSVDNVPYVIKRFLNADYPNDSVLFQARVSNFIYDHGQPTPEIVPNQKGQLVTIIGPYNYLLMKHIKGHHPDDKNSTELKRVFEGVARVNATLSHFKNTAGYKPIPRYSIPLQEQFDALVSLLPNEPKTEQDTFVLEHLEEVQDYITEVKRRVAKIKTPKQLIHGNINRTAALVDEGKLTGVIDYDLLRLDWRATDAMHTLDIYCFDRITPDLSLEKRVKWNKMKKLFQAYKKYDPEIVDEIALMPLGLAHDVGVNSIVITWKWGYARDAQPQQKKFFETRYAAFVNRVRIALDLEDRIINILKKA